MPLNFLNARAPAQTGQLDAMRGKEPAPPTPTMFDGKEMREQMTEAGKLYSAAYTAEKLHQMSKRK